MTNGDRRSTSIPKKKTYLKPLKDLPHSTRKRMELVPVRIYNNAIDAHMGRLALESSGIRCFLFDEHTVTANPLYGTAVGIRLMVGEDDLEAAHEALEAAQ